MGLNYLTGILSGLLFLTFGEIKLTYDVSEKDQSFTEIVLDRENFRVCFFQVLLAGFKDIQVVPLGLNEPLHLFVKHTPGVLQPSGEQVGLMVRQFVSFLDEPMFRAFILPVNQLLAFFVMTYVSVGGCQLAFGVH